MLLAQLFRAIVRQGELTVIDGNGRTRRYGDPGSGPRVTIRLHDRRLHWRFPLNPRLAVGEAYVDGTLSVEGGTIYDFLDLLGLNLGNAREAGLADRVDFDLRDYREDVGTYDRIVSVGMFEHVGMHHYQEPFDKVASLLQDDGVALLHTIADHGMPTFCSPWIRKYIFPGGYCPSLSEILPAIERAGLWATDIEILRLHYAETLRRWRERLNSTTSGSAACGSSIWPVPRWRSGAWA